MTDTLCVAASGGRTSYEESTNEGTCQKVEISFDEKNNTVWRYATTGLYRGSVGNLVPKKLRLLY